MLNYDVIRLIKKPNDILGNNYCFLINFQLVKMI